MRTSLFLAVALAVGAGAVTFDSAQAQTAREVRKQAEASLTLTGVIDIGREGQVEGFRLDKRDKVGEGVAALLESTLRQWRFEPVQVDGTAVPARTAVRLRLLADNMSEESMQVRVVDANFGPANASKAASTDEVKGLRLTRPEYPQRAWAMRGQGMVLLLVKVARDGTVADVVAEQTNLTSVGPARTMDLLRKTLADASVRTAKGWTFTPPTTGKYKDSEFWTVRVPVHYDIDNRDERYGRWSAYIPGPRQKAPWITGEDAQATGTDLLPEGGVYMVGRDDGPRLLTPLG